jgi:hypothetical protein
METLAKVRSRLHAARHSKLPTRSHLLLATQLHNRRHVIIRAYML